MSIEIFVSDAPSSVKSYQEVITFAGEQMVSAETIQDNYIAACIKREVDFPTGLVLSNGAGVAMPHGESSFVLKDSMSLVRAEQTIQFGRMEDKNLKVDCSLIFNLALASGEQHLTVLRKLIRLFQDEAFVTYCEKEHVEAVKEKLINYLV